MKLIDVRHPEHADREDDWEKFDAVYLGGHDFVTSYVEKFTDRETTTEYNTRLLYSYTPAFAKEAVNEVKNSIFQRISDVIRDGGSETYTSSMKGLKGGVDLEGSSMNSYIGRHILPELLTKGKVGVYVDMPKIHGITRASVGSVKPYIYIFEAQDILSWKIEYTDMGFYYSNLLLREFVDDYDNEWGLPDETVERYRYLYLGVDEAGNPVVFCEFYNLDGEQIDIENYSSDIVYQLNIPAIPFCVAELTHSLLEDVADYQIALVNLASSDMSYSLRSNFPFYVEQTDLRINNSYLRDNDGSSANTDANAQIAGDKRRSVGVSDGRQYPIGADKPGFIHPSSEPMEVSMKKQAQLKTEIKELVHLALTNVEPKMASAESKEQDQLGLEAGLSYIGLELETLERKISKIWMMYEGLNKEVTIVYPKRYSLKSDAEKRKEAEELKKILHNTPSTTYQQEITKRIAVVTLGDKVTDEKLAKIFKEIEDAAVLDTDPEIIKDDVEAGLVDLLTASKARGYPEGSVEQAKIDHAERLARINEAQAKIQDRGNPETDAGGEGSIDKKASLNKDKDDVVKDKQRGEGK